MHLKSHSQEYLHTIIMGPPGTGKTTVAKIIGEIYQKLCILSSTGKFRIAYRDDFIAEYLGQTAIKTRKLLRSCIGGVLFIDEVYSLAPRHSDRDSFSKEALDTLTAFLSEHKDNFCCIAAGYEDDIRDCFFAMNKGLQRRFPWVHKIDKYSSVELGKIFRKMVSDIGWECNIEDKILNEIFTKNYTLFKYAGGDIEIFISKCKMSHAKRVFGLSSTEKYILTESDLLSGIEMMKILRHEKSDDPPLGMYM